MVRPVVPLVAAVASAVAVLTACAEPEIVLSWEATVERVADGDSLVLKGGDRVRLLQIDAPELGEGECYGREALRALDQLLQPGDRVLLETDPGLDGADRHGRLLRYVHSGNTNVNVELVRRGAATAFFLGGDQGAPREASARRDRGCSERPSGYVGHLQRHLESAAPGGDALRVTERLSLE